MVPALQDSGVWIMSIPGIPVSIHQMAASLAMNDNANSEDGYTWVKPSSVYSGEQIVVQKQFVLKDGESCTLDDIVDAVLNKLEERSKIW